MSRLPGISQIRTFLKVYGAELRLLVKKNNTYHHPLWQPRALALNTPFSLAPPFFPALSPRPPFALEDSSPSLSQSLSRSRMPQKVTCRLWRYGEAGVLVFSGGAVKLGCTGRGVSQCERGTEHALGHEMHVPVLPTSVAWIPPPTHARRRHRGTHTWMPSFSVEHAFNIVNVSRMIVCPSSIVNVSRMIVWSSPPPLSALIK